MVGYRSGQSVRRVWEYDPTLYAPARYRQACAYDAFIPAPLADSTLTLPGNLAGIVSDAEGDVRRLNDTGSSGALRPLARLLLRTESIASSKVEGMQVDARVLARAEARADAGGKASPLAEEILANVDAMVLAVEEASTDDHFTLDRLLEVHRVLLERAPNATMAGRIRTTQNWIGGNDYQPCGAAFVPSPPEEVPQLLDDLVDFCGTEDLPPLVQAAIAHAQFETIHPFGDGNGRTGRALIQILLRRRGLATDFLPPISVVLAQERGRYIDGLTAYRAGDVEPWIERFAVATARAAGLAGRYLRQVGDLQEAWRERVRELPGIPRADAAVWTVIDVLPAHPVASGPILAAATGRSKPVINAAITGLVDAGVLLPLSEGRRNRTWEVAGLLDLLAELEAGGPP